MRSNAQGRLRSVLGNAQRRAFRVAFRRGYDGQEKLFWDDREYSSVGSRGGPAEPTTVIQAEARFRQHRPNEFNHLRRRILAIALEQGEVHGDDLAGIDLSQRNEIGAAINGLVKEKLLVSTGEHRKGTSKASHGRRSYVYAPTDRARSQRRRGIV